MNEPAGVLVKTTLVDFPGLIACSFFLPGCNLRCPYCYNIDLARGKLPQEAETVSLNQLFQHLEKRKNVLSGLTISGGEPLLSPSLPTIITKARALGYLIKLDTNGTQPSLLKALTASSETRPDFIAMDLKTSPERYGELAPTADLHKMKENLLETVQLVSEYHPEYHEFRTVLVPGLVTSKEILEMSSIIPENSSWKFAQFRNESCLSEKFTKLQPYTDQEIRELISLASEKVKGAELR